VMGAFPGYRDARCTGVEKPAAKDNVASMRKVIELHRDSVDGIQVSEQFGFLKTEARTVWDSALTLGDKHGYRNAQVTVLAPTGTIGFLMDCDTTGIEPDIALVKYKLLAGGGVLKIVNQTVRPALQNLGYNRLEVERIEAHIDEHDTIEDVLGENGEHIRSGLRAEHLPVFDCAFKPSSGKRSLHYRGHIKMMAAAQPFLSGAISKTVNLPKDATIDDIMNTYVEGWQLGLKAIAIYRDGSKGSAPIATDKKTHSSSNSAVADVEAVANEAEQLGSKITELESVIKELRDKAEQPLRKRMADTRVALTHKFDIAGHEGYITVGMFEDGQPGELFVQMQKEGSTLGGLMDTVGALTSMALQYGVPLDSMVRKFAHQRFEPSGFTKNPDIRTASSITDYVFRWLGCQFIKGYKEATSPNKAQAELPMKELAELDKKALNRPVPELERTSEAGIIDVISHSGNSEGTPRSAQASNTHADRLKTALGHMYMDTTCSNCGSSKVIRAGACGVCTECGTSQGCS
jgi:ribonucleoside-diphosphate reductase alpha chain